MKIDMAAFLSHFEIVEDDADQETRNERTKKIESYKTFIKQSNIPIKFQGACKEKIGDKIFNDILSDRQIFLKGQLGRGKSYSAGGYLNTIFLTKNISGVFVRCHQLENMDLNDLKAYIKSLEKRKIVVFDDIGYINGNEFVKRLVTSLILTRLEDELKTLITSNESLEDIFDPRSFDKIDEGFHLVEFSGKNRRVSK
jgi:DNA replication protein DnaC